MRKQKLRLQLKVCTCHLLVELLDFLLLFLVSPDDLVHFGLMASLHQSTFLVKLILKGRLDLGESGLVLLLQVFSGVLYLGRVGVGEAQAQCFKFAGFFDLLDIKARVRM